MQEVESQRYIERYAAPCPYLDIDLGTNFDSIVACCINISQIIKYQFDATMQA